MKPIINYFLGILIIVIGGYITYWSAIAWKEVGFALDAVYKMRDGNGVFFIILIGLALIYVGFDKILTQSYASKYSKDNDIKSKNG